MRKNTINIPIIFFLLCITYIGYIEIQNYIEKQIITGVSTEVSELTDSFYENQEKSISNKNRYETDVKGEILSMDDIDNNTLIGQIKFPSLDITYGIKKGDVDDNSWEAMRSTAAADSQYYLPGEGKHIVLAGHREYEFGNIYDLKVGDPIIINTSDDTFIYEVTDFEEIGEDEKEKVFYDSNTELLTLYTCFPRSGSEKVTGRYIVNAKPVKSLAK